MRGSLAAQRHARMAQLKRFKWPALAVFTSLAAFSLYAQSKIARSAGQAPATNLGWQSFGAAYNSRTSSNNAEAASALDTNATATNSENWWEDDEYNDEYDGFVPEPTAEIWDPFILNPRPLIEITAKSCIWPPSIYDTCMPESTMREDAEKGKWIRVEKDLNLRIGVYYLYLFYRRLPQGSSTATIREIQLLTKSEEKANPLNPDEGWHRVPSSLRDGVWPTQEAIYLYYRTAPRSRNSDWSTDEINEIDVIWGSSGTLPGWNRMHRDFADPKEKNQAKDMDEGAELMYRKGAPTPAKAELPLTFSADGNFKIMQIADLHFSVGKGKCLDSNWPGCKDPMGSDNVTLQWLGEVLDSEKPDLVILSGDQLNGQDTSYSAESVWLKVTHLFENRAIPWAAVLGNHDSEKTTLTRYGQMVMMSALPYFVGEPGPIEVDGEGNYVLQLYSADASRTALFTLYFLDSHAYASTLNPFTSEYDFLKESQITWFKNQSSTVQAIERPYSPPELSNDTFGIKDDLRRRQDLTSRTLKKPNAMAIFHIPLPEVYDEPPDMDAKSQSPLLYGTEEEGRGAPKKNSGFFTKALLAQTELGPAQAVDKQEVDDDPDYAAAMLNARPEVKVILNGHCHVTDQCKRIKGIWSCFAGGSSYSGYSKVGFDRRVRVYELSEYGETVKTYKILDSHADSSGVSESSTNNDADGQAANRDPAQNAEAELQAEIEALEGQSDEKRDRRRQGYSNTRQKIDEIILVGTGAPSF